MRPQQPLGNMAPMKCAQQPGNAPIAVRQQLGVIAHCASPSQVRTCVLALTPRAITAFRCPNASCSPLKLLSLRQE